jgi:hypothetical protein
MTIAQARQILSQAGYGVFNNRASFSSSRRGIHGRPTYRVYAPGADQPVVMTLQQVRELACEQYA